MQRLFSSIRKSAIAVMILMTAVAAYPVSATTLTGVHDYVTTLQTGSAANHQLVFTTPSGVALTQTITVEFASAFDTSTITEDDVDVIDDGTDLTTAATCAGSEQASVAMASDVLTITICAGDGGTIAAGSVVTIEIGTNATASGTGANRITNPSNAQTAYLSIAGTFADSASVLLPISSANTATISLNVLQPSTTNPPGSTDRTAPVITNVVVFNVTETSADISWDTDENADSKVDYGLTGSYELGTESDTSLLRAHVMSLTGLTPGTLYHFRVRSADLMGNEGSASDFTFTTLDSTAPEITNVQVVDITQTSVRITWQTNESADSGAVYGLTPTYGSTAFVEESVTEHSLTLTGLTFGTLYHFRVRSADAAGNQAESPDLIFTTLDNPPPTNVTNLVVTPGDAQNVLTWVNPLDEDFAGITIVACTNTYPSDAFDADCTVVFEGSATSFAHTGLANGTTYYYGVFARDTIDQYSSGTLGQGTPQGPVIPPVAVCGDAICSGDEDAVSCATDCAPSTVGVCGDGQCNVNESSATCPADCPVVPDEGIACGDGVCAFAESPSSCPSDCRTGVAVCGDGSCDAEETADSCSLDCVMIGELPGTTVGGGDAIPTTDVEFYVANRLIQLLPRENRLSVLPARRLYVQVLDRLITKDVERVELLVGDNTYLMAANFSQRTSYGRVRMSALFDDAYVAEISTPAYVGSDVLAVRLVYQDATFQLIPFVLITEPLGLTFEVRDGSELPVAGAAVTLLEQSRVWDGSPFGQFNPVSTETDGTFAWYVMNGDYALLVERSGYREAAITQTVEDNMVNPSVRLRRLDEEVPLIEEEGLIGDLLRGARDLATGIGGTVQDAVRAAQNALEDVRANSQVQQAAKVSVPALAVTTVASGIALTIAFDFLPFLQYVFSAPILFFWRRRRKGFGVVYNSVSKAPVDLAIVRLFALPEGKLIRSRVTDKQGRYFFQVNPGRYRISVVKAGFMAPTQYLKDVRDDRIYLDVYHGEPIEVKERDTAITVNIPMDPATIGQTQVPPRARWIPRLRLLQKSVAIAGVAAAVAFLIIRPSMLGGVMVAVQAALYLVVHRLASVRAPKSWGIVYDRRTGRPLSNVIARVFSPKYSKLLETSRTDSKGRYSFLLGPDEYFATFEKEGFATHEIRPIDLTAAKEPVEFGMKVPLAHQNQEQTQTKQPDTYEGDHSSQ